MRSTEPPRYFAERRGEVAVVADSQTAELAIFSSPESAQLAASKLETGGVTRDTYHWHSDTQQRKMTR